MSNSVKQHTVDDRTDEQSALERIATGYHGHPEEIRRLAAEQLVARYDYDSEEFDVLGEEADS